MASLSPLKSYHWEIPIAFIEVLLMFGEVIFFFGWDEDGIMIHTQSYIIVVIDIITITTTITTILLLYYYCYLLLLLLYDATYITNRVTTRD